jgi:hypothetical protein
VEVLRVDPVAKVATRKGALTNADAGKTETFQINESVRRATFALSWRGDRRPEALTFSLIAPDGTPVSLSLADVQTGPFYKVASVELPFPSTTPSASATPSVAMAAPPQVPTRHAGTWSMVLHPSLRSQEVAYRAHLIVDDADVRYQFSAPTAGLGVGEPIPLSLWVQRGNQTLTGLEDVEVTIHRPPTGFGTFLATNSVSGIQLAKPIDLSGDRFQGLAEKKAFLLLQNDTLRKALAPVAETISLFDDGLPEHGDAKAGDGVYSALYTKTQRPGAYKLDLSFRLGGPDGSSVVRTDSRTLNVGIETFDLSKSLIDVRPIRTKRGGAAYDVRVLLIDKYGNYLGPGHKLGTTIALPGQKWGGRRLLLADNLDGSYSGRVVLTPEELATGAGIRLDAGGLIVTQASLPEPTEGGPPSGLRLLVILLLILLLILLWIWNRP